jgi:hypothetical protein
MNRPHSAVDRILRDFHIDDASAFLDQIQGDGKAGFSSDPAVFIVGNIELAREKSLIDSREE